ncbi:hypothetical protein DBR32_12515 [Taibaiella sp. KBW10]|uniref:hypothetical protein n=1 Tax=Taibaiella sp. KBW10 TaxID=2153357 RepID=UPI000F59EF6C|nr:hypothetical protein [Taibaiella sp. KBW10]RQO30386.1 hypothetical protein DBR32_12515 [Taibaiella sp. KBW10]
MKKITLLILVISSFKAYTQGQNNITVPGNVDIGEKLTVTGSSKLLGGVLTPGILVGTATDNVKISLQNLSGGGKVLAFGFAGPFVELPTTCIKPYNSSSLSIFNTRAGVVHSASPNMLDFNNDGANGLIDYGYDIGKYALLTEEGSAPVPIPALKLNSLCYGDVEIARGGGYVATGNYLEVGTPVRNGGVALNVFAKNRIGQRITANSGFPVNFPNPPAVYNTQLFVNRDHIKALSVLNTVTNTNGDETFVVYGSGKTHIGMGRPLPNGVAANAMLSVDGTILAKEVRVAISTATHWADYVFEQDYKLMPLQEVEAFIIANKHLPEVPSAQEVSKDGIEVAEISAVLLKKIEELTLYTIELQKKLDAQQKEINHLQKH